MIARIAFRRGFLRRARPLRTYSTSTEATATAPSTVPSETPSTSEPPPKPKIPPPPPRTEWKQPLRPGRLRAFDEAMKIVEQHLEKKKTELDEVRKEVGEGQPDATQAKQIEDLEIEIGVQDPVVRWRFKRGLVDLSQTVYRHMTEQKWRNQGVLDRLMERIYQMNVIPDLLPAMRPSVDFELRFPSVSDEAVVPGVYLLPSQTLKPPEISVQAFHTEDRLYTILMVDPDVPDVDNQTFTTLLHWLVPNVSLNVLTPKPLLPPAVLPWLPPHPQNGTPYHRYSTFLLPQKAYITDMQAPRRAAFSLREFIQTYSLQGAAAEGRTEVDGGSCHMWREIWDKDVTKIYERDFKMKEPIYGKPKPVNPFLNEAGVKPRKYYT